MKQSFVFYLCFVIFLHMFSKSCVMFVHLALQNLTLLFAFHLQDVKGFVLVSFCWKTHQEECFKLINTYFEFNNFNISRLLNHMKCVKFVCAMYCQQLKLALKCNTPIKLHNICIKNSNIKQNKLTWKATLQIKINLKKIWIF